MYHQLTTLSAYSLLQSTIKIPRYIAAAKKAGYKVLGLADHNVLYGALEFYQQCQNAGIKPVIGVLFDCTFGTSTMRFPLYLFAKNLSGYRLLMRLSSEKMINGHLDLSEYLTLPDLFGILPQGARFLSRSIGRLGTAFSSIDRLCRSF